MNADFVNSSPKRSFSPPMVEYLCKNHWMFILIWLTVLSWKNGLYKCINPCVEKFWNKRGMDRPPERGDGSRKGWWKSLHPPYVNKVTYCSTNKRLLYMYCISAHMKRKVVQLVTRFMIIIVVYTEFHEINPNFKTFSHRILKQSSNCSLKFKSWYKTAFLWYET